VADCVRSWDYLGTRSDDNIKRV